MFSFFFLQRILAMDGAAQPHEFIFIDEARFDLSKTRRRGRNVIGQRAIVHVPGQRGGNITLCAAISLRGLLHHHAKLGPYNSQHILTFLDALHNIVVQNRPDQPRFVVIWDNVSFHRAALVTVHGFPVPSSPCLVCMRVRMCEQVSVGVCDWG